MSDDLIPRDVKIAAKRAFVRTTYQGYAASIPVGGVSAGTLVVLMDNPDPVVLIATAAAALLSPLLAGGAAWLNITSRGIPEDYTQAAEILPAKEG